MDLVTEPIDPTSAERLAAQHLRLDLVDTSDRDAFAAWYQADARGFYGPRLTPAQLEQRLPLTAYRRTTGVWDAASSDPESPVATVSSWPADLAVPASRRLDDGPYRQQSPYRQHGANGAAAAAAAAVASAESAAVPAWAISSVTVAPTHRRRGIARALLEAELRTASRLGVPIAMLTVSEATIYGRFGFGPAAFASDLTIETRRVRWSGPTASGSLHFIGLDELHEQGRAVYDAARRGTPGDIDLDDVLWRDVTGLTAEDDEAKHFRAVRFDDAAGETQGFALYRVTGGEDDFSKHSVEVRYVRAATDEAYAALWRYLLELDLVSTVRAPLRSVDEPVLWQIGDRRAATTSTHDHLWLRIIDLKAALEARGYAPFPHGQTGAGVGTTDETRIVLEVDDPLGFAAGRWMLSTDRSGRGTVSRLTTEAPADAACLALGIDDLASLYLGGVPASTLVRAGRVTELRSGSANAVDAVFRSPVAPWLSTWF